MTTALFGGQYKGINVMKYQLQEIGKGKYTTYFYKKNFEIVYKINHGNICLAKVQSDYKVPKHFQSNSELPKYITKRLK